MTGYLVIVMTMALLRDEGVDSYIVPDNQIVSAVSTRPATWTKRRDVPLVEAKLRRPDTGKIFVQGRLTDLLERSVQNHSGTLVVGRAGTGKTSLAADLASRVSGSAWYSIDASDADWPVFSRYFTSLVSGTDETVKGKKGSVPEARTPLELFADLTAGLELRSAAWPELLVLDGAHHLFDSDWFTEFFQFMIASLQPPSHVLVLSRSKPPTPLWRLRSKQVLNVIDEKVLAFSAAETAELFARHGIDEAEAAAAHKASFGRAAKLACLLEDMTNRQTVQV